MRIKTNILTDTFNDKWEYNQIFNEDNKESKKESNDAIYEQIFRKYMQAGITQEFSSKNKRSIFDGVNRDLVDRLGRKINDENKMSKIEFYTDTKLGILIMYSDIYPSKSAYSGKDTLSHDIETQTTFIEPYNLSVVPFYTSVPSGFNGTNLAYSKTKAIEKYLTEF